MMRRIGAALAWALLTASTARAQTVRLWPGAAPGSEAWTQQETSVRDTPLGTVVFNVVVPTLTAYLPDESKATGTGIIVAPGGAFVALAIDLEGTKVAKWLQERGIAAFVLKYRTVEKRQDGIPSMDMDTAGRYGIADGRQAVRVVRQHAAEWGVSPDRVGFLGFSAGAMVASGALLVKSDAARPNFAALLYGGPFGAMPPIPRNLPPVFLAWADDDPVALETAKRFRDALVAAGNTPDVHTFKDGGHGFGMRKQGTSSDAWVDVFYHWLDVNGWTRPVSSEVEDVTRASLWADPRNVHQMTGLFHACRCPCPHAEIPRTWRIPGRLAAIPTSGSVESCRSGSRGSSNGRQSPVQQCHHCRRSVDTARSEGARALGSAPHSFAAGTMLACTLLVVCASHPLCGGCAQAHVKGRMATLWTVLASVRSRPGRIGPKLESAAVQELTFLRTEMVSSGNQAVSISA